MTSDSSNNKNVTLYHVAERAGVSYQTVSRVVNNQPRVSAETRERVLQAIKDLNYHPSYAAQRLAANKTRTLALVTSGVSNYGPSQMLSEMERHAHSAGYELISLYINSRSSDDVDTAIDRLLGIGVDGIILIAPLKTPFHDKILRELANIPTSHCDVELDSPVPSVIMDQYLGSRLITEHLLALGHRNICEIRGPSDWYGANARHAGFVDTLAAVGVTPVAVLMGSWSPESGYRAANELLDNCKFSAIVAGNDHMALGVLSALSERGVRVPQDVSVAGFDNVEESPYYIPALTTVQQDFVDLGMTSLRYLLARMEDSTVPVEQKLIPTKLVVRKSTAAVD